MPPPDRNKVAYSVGVQSALVIDNFLNASLNATRCPAVWTSIITPSHSMMTSKGRSSVYSREEDDSPCGASSSSFLLALVLLRLLFLVSMAALAFLHFLILVKTDKDDDDDDDDDVRNVVRIIIGTFSVLLLREVLFFFPSTNKRERKRDHRSASLDLLIERLVGLLSSVVFFFCFRPFFVFFVFFFFFERERDGKLFEKI